MFLSDLSADVYLKTDPAAVTWTVTERKAIPGGLVRPISTIRWEASLDIGRVRYPLHRPLVGHFGLEDGRWVLRVETLSPAFLGRGETRAKAELDFKSQIHVTFQYLFGKRPFQMTTDERATWGLLDRLIDVPAYIRETPVEGREIGEVLWLRNAPLGIGSHIKVKWLGGGVEYIPITKAPAEMAGLRPGNWFEVILQRDPISHDLMRVTHVERTEPVRPMPAQEAQDYWDRLPKITSRPASEAV